MDGFFEPDVTTGTVLKSIPLQMRFFMGEGGKGRGKGEGENAVTHSTFTS